MHDRTWEIKQRINNARLQIPAFNIQVEELDALLTEAKGKFKHLEMAYETNPYKDTIRVQLKKLLAAINTFLESFVPKLVTLTENYYDYDDYTFAQDKWRTETAHPQFHKIFAHYQDCSVDMVFFDADLDDFRGILSFVKKQEGKYYEEMDTLIDDYTDLNEQLADFFEAVEKFDEGLIMGG
ncbi:hypothetical protein H8B06_10315 [Sphingobacterium sp. DN00404]|uniref:Uncharacterized protein n=1 Tax=Sphingobacterium micropteri TaxID=2763501 RepID=A0ABR7YPT5_9SPHI|nr:hypothetical protein [Sphingobacterium micropteri]MBD1433221.1 hypothetical protein [Sphingobacterium micropteri]